MGDVWATVADASEETQTLLADAMEKRSDDPVLTQLRDRYLGWLPKMPGGTVIEMGCGPGDVTGALLKATEATTAIGVDPSPVMIERAAKRHAHEPALTFCVGDARATTLTPASADLILFHTTLCHIPQPEQALAEVMRLLKPGGTLAIFDGDYATTTAALGPQDPIDGVIQHAMHSLVHDLYFCRSLPRRIADAGLTLSRLEILPYRASGNAAFFVSLFTRGLHFLQEARHLSENSAQSLLQELKARIRDGRFFGFCSFHVAIAHKPEAP